MLEILNNKFQLMLSFYNQILEIIAVPKNLQSPKHKMMTNRNVQNQLGSELFERTMETLRCSEPNKTEREFIKNEDKEINTNEEWNKISTIKIKRPLEQQNEIFSVDKTQKNFVKQNKKNVILKKSIIQRKNQETTTINSDSEQINNEKIKKLHKNLFGYLENL